MPRIIESRGLSGLLLGISLLAASLASARLYDNHHRESGFRRLSASFCSRCGREDYDAFIVDAPIAMALDSIG